MAIFGSKAGGTEISIKANVDEVRRTLNGLEKKQLPFATAKAITRTVINLKEYVPETMHRHMLGPVRFTIGAARYQKATKQTLTGAVYIERQRVPYLAHTIKGDSRTPRTFPYVMVPVGLGRLGGRGRVLNARLARSYRTQLLSQSERYFEGTIRGQLGIWERTGSKKSGYRGGIKLAVLYLPRTSYGKSYPFHLLMYRRARIIAGPLFDQSLRETLKAEREGGGL